MHTSCLVDVRVVTLVGIRVVVVVRTRGSFFEPKEEQQQNHSRALLAMGLLHRVCCGNARQAAADGSGLERIDMVGQERIAVEGTHACMYVRGDVCVAVGLLHAGSSVVCAVATVPARPTEGLHHIVSYGARCRTIP